MLNCKYNKLPYPTGKERERDENQPGLDDDARERDAEKLTEVRERSRKRCIQYNPGEAT